MAVFRGTMLECLRPPPRDLRGVPPLLHLQEVICGPPPRDTRLQRVCDLREQHGLVKDHLGSILGNSAILASALLIRCSPTPASRAIASAAMAACRGGVVNDNTRHNGRLQGVVIDNNRRHGRLQGGGGGAGSY